jgi:hypothetical protein
MDGVLAMRKTLLIALAGLILLSATSAEAAGFRRWHSRGTWHYDYAPIRAKRGDFYKVLNYCRQKYAYVSDMNAEFSSHWGQTGWFCVYKR